MKSNSIILVALFIIVTLIGCKKEEKVEPNKAPTCKIISPISGDEFEIGENITISVETEDSDGTIEEVRFYINEVGKGSASKFPYTYNWNTTNESSGNYTLKAISYDNDGETVFDEINIELFKVELPIAAFTEDENIGTPPLEVNFSDQTINNPTKWKWNFGDGGYSYQQNPSHLYQYTGEFTVTLIVENIFGVDTLVKNNLINIGEGPEARFTADENRGTAPFTVKFSDESEGNPISWEWDFGNGNSSTQQNPTYTFANTGSYTITLKVTNNFGSDTREITNYIKVFESGGPGTITDLRDGQIYDTIQIGDQTWIAQNMNYQSNNSWAYNDNPQNATTYGRLYTWGGAMYACPSGWRLPSKNETITLSDFLGGGDIAGGKLKEEGTEHWWSPNSGATNESGFTALPGGQRSMSGEYEDIGRSGVWWTSTVTITNISSHLYKLNYHQTELWGWGEPQNRGFSARCIKND